MNHFRGRLRPEDLAHLSRRTSLRKVELYSQITGDVWAHLHSLESLEESLEVLDIGDGGLAYTHLEGLLSLGRLHTLRLARASITGEAATYIAQLTRLNTRRHL